MMILHKNQKYKMWTLMICIFAILLLSNTQAAMSTGNKLTIMDVLDGLGLLELS